MAEFIKERLYPVSVAYKCDACHDGEMERNESMGILTFPFAQYPHKCNKCGETRNYMSIYPSMKYLTKAELNDETRSSHE